MEQLNWQPAHREETEALLGLIRALYAEDHLMFEIESVRRALTDLLATPSLGQAFLLRQGPSVNGYLVLTFGYSLEFGGRFALLDELYLAPEIRGRGVGRAALAFAENWARGNTCGALRLEVNRTNPRARAFYLRAGFRDDARDLLSVGVGPSREQGGSR